MSPQTCRDSKNGGGRGRKKKEESEAKSPRMKARSVSARDWQQQPGRLLHNARGLHVPSAFSSFPLVFLLCVRLLMLMRRDLRCARARVAWAAFFAMFLIQISHFKVLRVLRKAMKKGKGEGIKCSRGGESLLWTPHCLDPQARPSPTRS